MLFRSLLFPCIIIIVLFGSLACTTTQEVGLIGSHDSDSSADQDITVFNPNGPDLGETLSFAQRYTLAVSPTGNRAFASDRQGTVRTIVSLDGTPSLEGTLDLPHRARVLAVMSPQILIAAGTDLQNASKTMVTTSLASQIIDTFEFDGANVVAMDICDDETLLLARSGSVRKLIVSSNGNLSDTGEVFSTRPIADVRCAPGSATAIVVTTRFRELHAIDLETMDSVDTREVAGSFGLSGAFNPDGDRFFARSEGFVEVFDFNAATGSFGSDDPLQTSVALVNASYQGVRMLAVRNDGNRVFVTDPENDRVVVLNASTLVEADVLSGSGLHDPLSIVIGGE